MFGSVDDLKGSFLEALLAFARGLTSRLDLVDGYRLVATENQWTKWTVGC